MTIENLNKIFKPKRIAVIGASRKPGSVGQTLLRNLISSEFEGTVYPVNPKYEAIQGIHAYSQIGDVPHVPDLAVICIRAEIVPQMVRECGEMGIGGIIIVSAGFRETGASGKALEERIRDEQRKFPGMRILGPNCLGVIVPGLHLNASFATTVPQKGQVAFISQSGALCTSVLDWALREELGFSYFISIGNMLDVTFSDIIDYLGADSQTRSIVLYVESITDPRMFMSAARAFARIKPIVAYKAGRFAESAQAATSHTGALAGEDAVYDAAFQRAGIERVFEISDLFDCAELLARKKLPRGARLAIVTNAGGPGVIAIDALIARNGLLASLSDQTLQKLDAYLPSYWSHGNPVDVLGDAPPERFSETIRLVLEDPQVDAVLAVLTPQAMTDPTGTARAVSKIAEQAKKPILASWMGGDAVWKGVQILNRVGIPTYTTPEQAVNAFMHLVSYARNLEVLYETPRDVSPVLPDQSRKPIEVFQQSLHSGNDVLSEEAGKSLLEAYGIPVTRTVPAHSADEAVRQAQQLGYPVVLKILSPQITHKTDVGGVRLNLTDDEAVRRAFNDILESARQKRPEADVQGVTVQTMRNLNDGVEMILGAKKDPTFGSVLMVGLGGIAAEVFRDRSLELPPLNERLARRMLESLRFWPLLKGHRGRPAVDLDQLVATLICFSYLIADCPEIAEFDINPLLVTPGEVIALDARGVIDRSAVEHPLPAYSHLSIRPYPQEYIRQVELSDGTAMTLRPIRPEDEPLWHGLLAECAPESIRARFHSLFRTTTHQMASRYCFIDYDREMAIVAVVETETDCRFAGVGRLVANPDHQTAEYAILVADRWQGKGLGESLTRYCIDLARNWGVQTITAETTTDNDRMLSIFRKTGFEMKKRLEEQLVLAEKSLESP